MKSRPRLFTLFFSVGLLICGASLSHAQPAESLTVSKFGTLLDIVDANGKSRFGKPTADGFEISYQFKGKTISVFASGDQSVRGLIAGDLKTDKQSATATTRTSDGAMEITTYFSLDEKTKKLIIQRAFRNISAEPVVVQSIVEYVAPALVISAEQKETGDKPALLARNRLTRLNPNDCQAADCPKTPPPCPLPCPMMITFDLARMTIRNNRETGRPEMISLPVQGTFELAPSVSKTKELNNGVFIVLYLDAAPPGEIR